MDITTLRSKLESAQSWLSDELAQISTGRATPALLDSVTIDVYGAMQPVKSVASITLEDARTLRVSPWDKSQIKSLEQAVHDAKLPVSVSTDEPRTSSARSSTNRRESSVFGKTFERKT